MSKLGLLSGMVVLAVFLAACSAVGAASPEAAGESLPAMESTAESACPVTVPVQITPPDDAAIPDPPLPEYFFANADQSILASAWWWTVDERWHAGKDGNKVGWFKPSGAEMEISGRRLDAPAEPLQAHVPAGYPTRFQAAGLYFPTEGCWEVTAQAAGSQLVFVVEIAPAP